MESVQEGDPRGRRRQRERQQVAQEWRQGINESERQISSLLRRFARKVDRCAVKAEPQAQPANQRVRWSANRLLAHAKTLQAVKAAMEAGADYVEEVKNRGRAAQHKAKGSTR